MVRCVQTYSWAQAVTVEVIAPGPHAPSSGVRVTLSDSSSPDWFSYQFSYSATLPCCCGWQAGVRATLPKEFADNAPLLEAIGNGLADVVMQRFTKHVDKAMQQMGT
jgi:dihydroneopterin aldolase